ncbi:MAG TPA: Holliday junction resolvase RuvX [Syntrophales bacterium]|nr:Holliday junction resolvase RuvX [Syntrophales bacterium]
MRILGLDYGSKRIGVAVCDELGITAQGLATITRKNRRQVLEEIARFIRTYAVERIVIGYPIKLDGTEGIQCDKIKKFARLLESTFVLPVIKWDETLTTKEAEEILILSNVRREHRKGKIDKLAAVLILQGYLDSQRRYEKDKNHPQI